MIKYNYNEISFKQLNCLISARVDLMSYYAWSEIVHNTDNALFFINLIDDKDPKFDLGLCLPIINIHNSIPKNNLCNLILQDNDNKQ